MRILFFSRLFYPHIGGVERHVYRLSKELINRGHKVVVITELHDKKLKEKEIYEGITIYRIPINTSEKKKKFVIWKWLWKHRSLIKSANIIHSHDVFFWYFPFTVLYPFKKIYITFHGYEGNNMPTWRAKAMHSIAESLSAGNICIGDFLTKWYGTRPTFISYGATDIPKKVSIIKVPKNNIKAIFIGRLEEETGILEYLQAVNVLSKKNVHINLEILGNGSQIDKVEHFISANKLSVQINGFVPNPENYLKQADIVFVSRYLGILEALAAKRAVYALYNNLIKKDYLQMAPFANEIVIAKSATELVDKIQNDLANSNYTARIERGYKWVYNQTWRNLTDLYLKLWQVPM